MAWAGCGAVMIEVEPSLVAVLSIRGSFRCSDMCVKFSWSITCQCDRTDGRHQSQLNRSIGWSRGIVVYRRKREEGLYRPPSEKLPARFLVTTSLMYNDRLVICFDSRFASGCFRQRRSLWIRRVLECDEIAREYVTGGVPWVSPGMIHWDLTFDLE